MKLKHCALVLLSAISLSKASADDIYKGVRGPTRVQADGRMVFSKSNETLTLANTLVMKYWDGEELGLFGFGTMSYKHNKDVSGFSDVTLGIGPRAARGIFNTIDYVAATLPTGSNETSNHRVDFKIGSANTLLFTESLGIDAFVEYTFTGTDSKGINPPNELYLSILSEAGISGNLRAAFGVTRSNRTDGKNAMNLRAILRYIPGKAWHPEVVLDRTISSSGIPETTNMGIFVRYNF